MRPLLLIPLLCITGGCFMKKGYIEKWEKVNECTNLLFFAQLCAELLFDYSNPSNRISTLNSHFLCYDAISAIRNIEANGVPEGTLKPIVEELFSSLQKDTAFILEGDNPTKYFIKQQGERFHYIHDVKELNYEESKKIVFTINQKYFSNNDYYDLLKKNIISIIIENSIDNQEELFRLTKSVLTELVNHGYSENYIYEQLLFIFFNRKTRITSPEHINKFFDLFTFEDNSYDIVFIADDSINEILAQAEYAESLNILPQRTHTKREETFLNKSDNEFYVLIKEQSALDPYSSAEMAKYMMKLNMAFYNLSDHNYKCDLETMKCGVYDSNNYFTIIRQSISAVHRAKTPTKESIETNMILAYKALHANRRNTSAIINAVNLHALSLNSLSEENQLLDLWAVFEAILNISNRHTSDRINQVCLHLVPILKRRYIYSLFLQLAFDIKNYSEAKYNEIAKDATEEFEVICNLCNYVILEEFRENREAFLSTITDFPLLVERINYYNMMLSTIDSIKSFVEKHSTRVRWQIMRIYRNRNLVIHNGETMPYSKLLIENLHSYVDDFLSYTISSLSEGNSVDGMCQELFSKECEWIEILKNNKVSVNANIIKSILMQV